MTDIVVVPNEFKDTEFALTGAEKINYQQILFKQIDTIRVFRNQDMGEFMIFKIKPTGIEKGELKMYIKNSSIFQQSVNVLIVLISNYEDEKFVTKLNEIDKKYNIMLNKLKRKNIIEFEKHKRPDDDLIKYYKDNLELIKTNFSLTELPNQHDEKLRECLALIQRCKMIGGNDMFKEGS